MGSKISRFSFEKVCGFLPAAGFGSRMAPLTHFYAKPSLEFFGHPIISWVISKYLKSGFIDLAVNLHHLPETIEPILQELEKADGRLKIHRSLETPEILGTGGSYLALKEWRSNRHVLVHNTDIYSNLDLRDFAEHHFKQKKLVTMAILPPRPNGTVQLDQKENKVLSIQNKTISKAEVDSKNLWVGAGIFLFSPDFFKFFPNSIQTLSLAPFLEKAIAANEVSAYLYRGVWWDLGSSPKDYLSQQLSLLKDNPFASDLRDLELLLKKSDKKEFFGGRTLSEISTEAKIKNSIVGSCVRLNSDAELTNCIVYSGTVLNHKINKSQCIICNDLYLDC